MIPGRNPSNTIRKAYYDRLNNAVVFNGKPVPVYDSFAPENAVLPYIIMRNIWFDSNLSTKDGCKYRVSFRVECVSGATFTAGYKDVDTIADEMIKLLFELNGNPNIVVGPDFHLVSIGVEGSDQIDDLENKEYVYRKIITFNHILQQLQSEGL